MRIWLNNMTSMTPAQWVQQHGTLLPAKPIWPSQERDWYPCALIDAIDHKPVLICWFRKEMEYVEKNYKARHVKWFQVSKEKLKEQLGANVFDFMRFHLEDDPFQYGD